MDVCKKCGLNQPSLPLGLKTRNNFHLIRKRFTMIVNIWLNNVPTSEFNVCPVDWARFYGHYIVKMKIKTSKPQIGRLVIVYHKVLADLFWRKICIQVMSPQEESRNLNIFNLSKNCFLVRWVKFVFLIHHLSLWILWGGYDYFWIRPTLIKGAYKLQTAPNWPYFFWKIQF